MIREYPMPKRKTHATENWQSSAAFVGIDYHKRTSTITIGDKSGCALYQMRHTNSETELRNFFQQLPAGTTCAIEACRGYEWLLDLLTDLGLKVHIANAHAVKLIAQSRCKTDKVDSKILMELLSKGFLPTCYQATAEERALRERLRWRAQLVRTCTKFKNMVHAILDKENGGFQSVFSKKGRKQLDCVTLEPCRDELLGEHLHVIDFFDTMLEREAQWIRKLANQLPETVRLKTIPGIGDIVSLMYLAEVGDVTRFRNASAVSAFLGLVPAVYSSADSYRTGRITKKGCRLLRWLLIQSAWQAIKVSGGLRARFNKISKRTGKRKAIVAIARKLAEIAFRILRDHTTFDEKLWALG